MYVKNTDDDRLYRFSNRFDIEKISIGELCALFGEDKVKVNT